MNDHRAPFLDLVLDARRWAEVHARGLILKPRIHRTFDESEEQMTTLYAQPYNMEAQGFYFTSQTEFASKSADNRDRFGQPVEEYEIQFIDGERLDAEFASALGLNQVNLAQFFELAETWEDREKIRFIIANGECGYQFDPAKDDIDQLDIDIYEVGSLKELAERFVGEGLFGEVPKAFENYLDYDAIAGDLSVDYATTTIDGEHIAYR